MYLFECQHRNAFAKCRRGVAPMRIETGRNENLPMGRGLSLICDNQSVEDEVQVFINCPLYEDFRFNLYEHAQLCFSNFMLLSGPEKLCVVMSESNLAFITANTCFYILQRHGDFFFFFSLLDNDQVGDVLCSEPQTLHYK